MIKNKAYIGVAFIAILFGFWAIPKIIQRFKTNNIVQGSSLDKSIGSQRKSNLETIGKAPIFELTNQNNEKITDKSYLGKVYVVEFFFTSCGSICPKMNKNMSVIQNKFFGNSNFGIASITIDPEHDTVALLKIHAEELGVKSINWNLLTGSKDYIYDLSNKGFNLYAGQNSKLPDGFEHSGLFALIDKTGKIRCRKDDFNNPIIYYDGLDKKGIKDLMQDITKLLEE